MIIGSEQEMLAYGKEFGKKLKSGTAPVVLELLGDVGAGKTTFMRGAAEGLGVKEPISSPSFTICRTYAYNGGNLAHYDFYRLPDPGLMLEDLQDAMRDYKIVAVEWADSVADILPEHRTQIKISYLPDGRREVETKVL